MKRLSCAKIIVGFIVVALAVFCAQFGQPLIHGKDQPLNVIITAFSIFAGVLIALIAVLGDPSMVPSGSWRVAEFHREKIKSRLVRHKSLFVLYMATVFGVFISLIIPKNFQCTIIFVEKVYLFFATIAFYYSLYLPWSMVKNQLERIDHIIEERRKQDNIKD